MKSKKIYTPIGFKAGGTHCGIKKRKKDLALIYSTGPAICAGTFTLNKFAAAPVKLTKKIISKGTIQAIIANSGNANALTGNGGKNNALKMIETTANVLKISKTKVAVASTGVIGKQLPIKKITIGIKSLAQKITPDSFKNAAEAILTTDTAPKYLSKQIKIGTRKVTITAIAKGSGMIYPNMATMLCFIATDLNISRKLLEMTLKNSVNSSFNCISVDACTSTNDTVLIMANGMAGNPTINKSGKNLNKFQKELNNITKELAKMIVKDGEGATKLIQIDITGARTKNEAKTIGFSIANYGLLKCAFYGNSLSLGRIVAAIGSSNVNVKPDNIDIYLENNLAIRKGVINSHFSLKMAKIILRKQNINLKVKLNHGTKQATVWGSDLSPEYVKINM